MPGLSVNNIKIELEVTNTDELLEAAKRLKEISNELSVLAWKLQVKTDIKEKEPEAKQKQGKSK